MEHAVTIGDILLVSGIFLGLMAVCAAAVFVIWLLNPFQSGH